MADVHFSWSDSFQAAFSSCLPCLKGPSSTSDVPSDTDEPTPQPNRYNAFAHAIPPPRARPDELEGLLADASDDADALSLHTNPGDRSQRRKKRRRAPKHIRVFGFDLFGRPPAIQLPDSDDEDARTPTRRGGSGRGRDGERARTISSSSMDSDAAPLDAAAIQELSAARNAEALAREEEERRAKEERRRKRRERKELKRAAMARALDLQTNGEQDFEGFQGSGPVFGHPLPSPFAPSLTSGTGSGSMSISSSQEFGPFAHGQPVENFDPDAAEAAREAAEAEADGADFGGESYTSRPRKPKSKSGAMTASTSDTRSSSSRGTGSNGYAFVPGSTGLAGSGAAPYNHQFLAHQPFSPSPLSPGADAAGPPSPLSESTPAEKKKRRKSKSKPMTLSLSHSTSSQSATASSSLTSPPPSAHTSMPAIAPASAGAGDDFEGFPGDLGGGALVDVHAHAGGGDEQDQVKKAEYLPVTGFPSVGLRGIGGRNSDMGVFLARRGDE